MPTPTIPKRRRTLRQGGGKTLNKNLPFQNTKSGKPKRILALVILFFIATGGLTVWLLTSPTFTIDTITIENTEDPTDTETTAAIQSTVEPLKGQNIWRANTEAVTTALTTNFPELATISLKKIFPRTIKVVLTVHPVVANVLMTIDNTDVGKQQKKYLVNEEGLVVEENFENPNLPYLTMRIDAFPALRTTIITPEMLKKILDGIELFTAKFGLKVFDSEYMKVERELRIRTEKYFTVWIDLEQDFEKQLNKLKKALPKLDIYNTPLEYIDLRISGINGDKIIYKPR